MQFLWEDPEDRRTPSRRIHVLHVMTRYLRGGSEKRLRDIVTAFPEATHELIVGAESSLDVARKEVEVERIHLVPSLVRAPNPWQDTKALTAILKVLRGSPADLVVTHQSKAGVLGRLAASWAHRPAVHSLSMANFGPGYSRLQSVAYRLLEQRLHRSTAAYVVVGRDLARRYAGIGVPQEKLHVVRSGVRLPSDEDRRVSRTELRDHLGIRSDRPVLAYVGSLEPRKNVLDLVPLLCRVLEAHRGATPFLAIAGEGPLAGGLAALIRRRGLDADAAMLGFVEKPIPLIAGADGVVLLSQAEGVSQVLTQAAAVDTPFVAYSVDGVGELLAMGARGRAVPLGDVVAASRAATDVLGWTERSSAPSIDLSPWSQDSIASGYRHVFDAVLANSIQASHT